MIGQTSFGCWFVGGGCSSGTISTMEHGGNVSGLLSKALRQSAINYVWKPIIYSLFDFMST